MKRPFADKRPIGPLLQSLNTNGGNVEPRSEQLEPNEIRIIIGRLLDSVEDSIGSLEAILDDEVSESLEEQIVRMINFNKRNLDSAAEKLAGQHRDARGDLPNAWREYKEKAEKRDKLLEEVQQQ